MTPDDLRGLRFERDDVLARRDVHDAVDHERRHLQAVDAGVERPRRLQRCDVGRRDLLQRREALAAGVVIVRRPVVDAGGDDALMRPAPRRARRRAASSSSERELQRELHDSRVAGRLDLSPKLALFSAVTGALKFTWLITLKTSHRNCTVCDPADRERARQREVVLKIRRVHDA